MGQDDKATDKYDHIQVVIVCHTFVHMNVEVTMDRIGDRFLCDSNIDNV